MIESPEAVVSVGETVFYKHEADNKPIDLALPIYNLPNIVINPPAATVIYTLLPLHIARFLPKKLIVPFQHLDYHLVDGTLHAI